jgi:hypothetical protein
MSLEDSSTKAASFKDLFSMGEDKLAYRFGLCILLQFFQQMSGTNLISVYASTIFQQGLGMTAYNSKLLSAGTLTWKFLSCFVAFFCIDRFGRRVCFMVSGGGMAMCMLALAVATSFPHDNYPASVCAAFFVYLFCFFTPIGFLGANFLYCTEVAPIRLRVAMASISTANHWLWNFVSRSSLACPLSIQQHLLTTLRYQGRCYGYSGGNRTDWIQILHCLCLYWRLHPNYSLFSVSRDEGKSCPSF